MWRKSFWERESDWYHPTSDGGSTSSGEVRVNRLCSLVLPVACAIASCLAMALTSPPAAAAENAPATKPVASTYHDLRREALEFNRRTLGGAYEKVGKHDPKWDAKAKEYLELIAQQFANGAVPGFYQKDAMASVRP